MPGNMRWNLAQQQVRHQLMADDLRFYLCFARSERLRYRVLFRYFPAIASDTLESPILTVNSTRITPQNDCTELSTSVKQDSVGMSVRTSRLEPRYQHHSNVLFRRS